MSALKAVVIGGGTGAPRSIRTLLDMGLETAAIVSMADDGGSTGILRERGGVIPPGDIRKCIVAMAPRDDGIVARVFSHRFSYLDDTSLGNLIITGCAEEAGSFPAAIALCEGLIHARGHVYPSTLRDVVLSGETVEGDHLEGETVIGDSPACMENVLLSPADAQAYQPALNAIQVADLIVLGPGSLFTSIIPNLLVPGIVEAIEKAHSRAENPAKTVFVCSLADMQGETWGMDALGYVDALCRHGMEGILDAVLLHRDSSASPYATGTFPTVAPKENPYHPTRGFRSGTVKRIILTDEMIDEIADRGITPIVRDFACQDLPTWHDMDMLARAFEEVLGGCHSRQG